MHPPCIHLHPLQRHLEVRLGPSEACIRTWTCGVILGMAHQDALDVGVCVRKGLGLGLDVKVGVGVGEGL